MDGTGFDVTKFGLDVDALSARIERPTPVRRGKVTQVVGLVVEGHVPDARVGSLCEIAVEGGAPVTAEVVGFRGGTALMMPLGDIGGVRMGSLVTPRQALARVPVGDSMLGRVFDGLGQPLDGRPVPVTTDERSLYAEPLNPLQRRPIEEPMWLGIRAIDTMLTCGRGQRVGIFAGGDLLLPFEGVLSLDGDFSLPAAFPAG